MARMKLTTCVKFAIAAASLTVALGQANAADISIRVNQAKIIKLARAADTVIIGNPLIADASVQDSTTLVLTGKGFGSTNLVVLDSTGAPVVDQQVVVSRDEASTIRIYRRANIQTLSCTPNCEAAFLSDAEKASQTAVSSQ